MGNKLSYPQNDIPADRTFIVTGGNTGIGYQTAKCIAKLGGRVIIACRSEERANEAIGKMQKEHQEEVKQDIQERDDAVAKETKPATKDAGGASAEAEAKPSGETTDVKEEKEASSDTKATDAKEKEPSSETNATHAKEEKDPPSETTATDVKEEKEPVASADDTASSPKEDDQEIQPLKVEFMKLDLSSLASTMEFVNAYKAKGYALHVLICNAGLGLVPFQKTDDGFELQFEVNYLSHFLMTLHLLPLLRESAPDSRIINVSSVVHSSGTFDLKNIQGEVSYDRMKFYSNSKVYQIMNMYALTRRLKGAGISVFSVHPGYVDSEFSRGGADNKLYSFVDTVSKALHIKRNVEDGAMTSLLAALDNSYDGRSGLYFKDCKITNPSALSRDIQKQEQLWNYSLDCLKNYVTEDLLKDLQLPEPLASELKPAEVAADSKTGDGAEAKPEGAEAKPEGAESKSEEGASKSEEAAEPKADEGDKSKPEEGTESKPEEGGESKPEEKVESKPEEGTGSKPEEAESQPEEKAESQPEEKTESHEEKAESKSEEEAKTTPEEGSESKPAEEGSESKPERGDESKPEEVDESKPEEEIKGDEKAVNSKGPEDGEGK